MLNLNYPAEWHLDERNNVCYKNTSYVISCDRLTESDWIAHLSEKSWFNMGAFLPVYIKALDRVGISDEDLGKLIRKSFLNPYGV